MSKRLAVRRARELAQANTYPEWREIAGDLDRLEGGEAWKQDEVSEDYDVLLIRKRYDELRELRQRGDVSRLVFRLAEGLHGNIGNIANPRLYVFARIGTKRLIEQFVDEIVRCLDYICVGDFPDFSNDDKVLFFKRTGTSFGRSALLLSGGATLGLFHLGVLKALHEEKLLPRVISGSSAGSIMAAMVATRNDEELPGIFDADNLNLQAFQKVSLKQALTDRSLMDQHMLQDCLQTNIRPSSFLEAFEHSRRILGVTVSPAEPNQQSRLLNYLTAPNVLIHKAVQASCAVPGVFPPVMLEAMDYNGDTVPYLPSKRWVDGSLSDDLPLLRLARLHNVNHYIVSQTNPHIVPFMRNRDPRKRGLFAFSKELVSVAGRDAVKVARLHLGQEGALGAARIVDQLNDILQQRYAGDISIVPRQNPAQLMRLFSNPSADDIRRFIRDGERATWPKIERIRIQTRISQAFDDCLSWLKTHGALGRGASRSRSAVNQ